MDVRTYRAATMQEALSLVRRELGPEAAVLHTREVHTARWFGLLGRSQHIEVTAARQVNVPSRLPQRRLAEPPAAAPPPAGIDSLELSHNVGAPAGGEKPAASGEVQHQLRELQAMVQQLCRRTQDSPTGDLPESLFRLYTDLIEADIDEELARSLVEEVRSQLSGADLADHLLVRARIARMIESQIAVTGPIQAPPNGRRIVALVGPTGVGKTTTIAKLAAQYRLKQRRRVGLITVDTYRIAAVEQLRTYADIIDLPMQVVSTPREMREAVRRMEGLELVLMDTAGRSPKDDVKIRELRAFLTEAQADEVHLVLSTVAHPRTMQQTADKFSAVGATALILTKLDESTGLGNLLPLLARCGLPLSYLTNGQNVPDDIAVADPQQVARLMLEAEKSEVRS